MTGDFTWLDETVYNDEWWEDTLYGEDAWWRESVDEFASMSFEDLHMTLCTDDITLETFLELCDDALAKKEDYMDVIHDLSEENVRLLVDDVNSTWEDAWDVFFSVNYAFAFTSSCTAFSLAVLAITNI